MKLRVKLTFNDELIGGDPIEIEGVIPSYMLFNVGDEIFADDAFADILTENLDLRNDRENQSNYDLMFNNILGVYRVEKRTFSVSGSNSRNERDEINGIDPDYYCVFNLKTIDSFKEDIPKYPND